MPTTYINNSVMPKDVFDAHMRCIPRLAGIVLDTQMNRLKIEGAIRSDVELKLVLRGYVTCTFKLERPRPVTAKRFQLGEVDITDFKFAGTMNGGYAKTFVMPPIIGVIIDPISRDPWWVGSPEEFETSVQGLQTSNIGGMTTFDLCFLGASRNRRPMRRRRRTA